MESKSRQDDGLAVDRMWKEVDAKSRKLAYVGDLFRETSMRVDAVFKVSKVGNSVITPILETLVSNMDAEEAALTRTLHTIQEALVFERGDDDEVTDHDKRVVFTNILGVINASIDSLILCICETDWGLHELLDGADPNEVFSGFIRETREWLRNECKLLVKVDADKAFVVNTKCKECKGDSTKCNGCKPLEIIKELLDSLMA